MFPRQARVLPEFSEQYARISPGEWHHALWVREKALADLRAGASHSEGDEGGRILSEGHFEFRGGYKVAKAVRGVERRMPRPTQG